MSNKVSISHLSNELSKQLDGYFDDRKDELDNEMKRIGKNTVKILKKTSPKRTGAYAKGWRSKVDKYRLITIVTVHNKKYQLTHLLEHEHAYRGGKHSTPQAHIAPAQKYAEDELMKAVKEVYGA